MSRRPVSYMFQCIECLGSAATRRRVARCAPHGLASTYCLSSRSSRSFQCGVAVMPALRVGVRRCRAIVASSDSGCGSACITNACFMRSRCTSMPQKRKCGMRRRFAKQCLHAGFYSLKVLTGYADRVRIMRPGAPGRICMVAPSFSTARTRIQRFAIAVDARSRTARTLRSVCLSTDETLTPF